MPKKKPAIGRPPKKPGEKVRTPMRYFRCDDETYAEFEAAALAKNQTTSEWIRETLTRATRRQK